MNNFTATEKKAIKAGIEKCLENQDLRAFLTSVHGVDYETAEYNELENQSASYDLLFSPSLGKVWKAELYWGKTEVINDIILFENVDYIWEDDIEVALNSLLD